jgi:hypothetical protein
MDAVPGVEVAWGAACAGRAAPPRVREIAMARRVVNVCMLLLRM